MEGKETVYVIGHKNPDTDSVCSAICYARLKEKMTGQWINISELKAYYSEMESWSKIYIDTVL